jgi:hypothetical protein
MSFVKTNFALPSVTDRNGRVVNFAFVPGRCPVDIKRGVVTRGKQFVSNMRPAPPRALRTRPRLMAMPAGKSLGAIVARRQIPLLGRRLNGLGLPDFPDPTFPDPTHTSSSGGNSTASVISAIVGAVNNLAQAAQAASEAKSAAQQRTVAPAPAPISLGISSPVAGLPLWGWGLIGVGAIGTIIAVSKSR